MEEERAPVLYIVGDEPDVPRPEISATSSSSRVSSGGWSRDDADTKAERIRGVDPRESMQSYDFGASTVTVDRIRQLELLGYFAKGSMKVS
jgi:hypothetical protein